MAFENRFDKLVNFTHFCEQTAVRTKYLMASREFSI